MNGDIGWKTSGSLAMGQASKPGRGQRVNQDAVAQYIPRDPVLAARSPRQGARMLVETARRRGGQDDASAIVVALGRPARQPRPVMPAPSVAPRPRYGAAAGAVALNAPAQQMLLLALGLGVAGVTVLLGMMLLAAGG